MIAAIIQARMESTRLPGKVAKKIEDKPLLWYVWQRAKQIKPIDQSIIATGNTPENDWIRNFCKKNKIICFSGHESDVLDRYYQAAKKYQADVIVRITADCPLLDPKISSQVLQQFLKIPDLDIAGLSEPFPDGLDTEVISFSALKKAHQKARLDSEREHLTQYLWKHPKIFKQLSIILFSSSTNKFRLTVDQPRDLKLIQKIYQQLIPQHGPVFSIKCVLKLLHQQPNLIKINQSIIRNQGLQKSLQEDEKTIT